MPASRSRLWTRPTRSLPPRRLTITVTAVADAPVASDLDVSTAEDTALTFTAANFEDAFSDPDADDSLKAVKVVTLPEATAGELALDGTAVTAGKVIEHADLKDLVFTPVANWHGDATFDFKVVDQTDAESRNGDGDDHGGWSERRADGERAEREHGGGHGAFVHGGPTSKGCSATRTRVTA